MRRSFVRCFGLTAVLVAVAGCGDSVTLVPAEGVVTINGTPAPNISIQFMPDSLAGGAGPTSFAVTDAAGKFSLKTNDGRDGAVPGTHVVVLSDVDEERPAQGQRSKRRFSSRLDAKYGIADPKNGLRVEVTGTGPIEVKATGPR